MVVLSLFGGMECGRITLDLMGVVPTKYYSSEIDKHARKEVAVNYPDVIQLGDINDYKNWDIDWQDIDLVIGGSPCQGFSFAGKQLAFDDPRSRLFFVFVEILRCVKTMRLVCYGLEPDFMLENVRMKKEYLDVISEYLGVEPVFLNSALVSAQNRRRYYWANWAISAPGDTEIFLSDILESEGTGVIKNHGEFKVKNIKSQCLDANYHKGADNHGQRTLIMNIDGEVRKLTVNECCRLQGVPDNYFKVSSNTQSYKMLGNGWQVDTIKHILQLRFKMNNNHKNARQYSDQIHCSYCGKQWDINDIDPPECEKFTLEIKTNGRERLQKLRESLNVYD